MLSEEEIDQTIRDTETDSGHYHKGHYLKVIKQLKEERDKLQAHVKALVDAVAYGQKP